MTEVIDKGQYSRSTRFSQMQNIASYMHINCEWMHIIYIASPEGCKIAADAWVHLHAFQGERWGLSLYPMSAK